MSIRMTGLISGLDTDSIVQALMSAQSMKKTKIENKKTKLEWKQEIWSSLNTKLYNFYTSSLGKIKMQSTYNAKAATSSDSSKVTATATSSAAEGTYTVKVNSLASAQYVTSGKVSAVNSSGESTSVTSKTKLVNMVDSSGNSTFEAGSQICIETEDGTTLLTVDESTTVSDFVSACQDAGLTASFDEDQQRFFISSSTSGSDQAFQISVNSLSTEQSELVSSIKEALDYDNMSSGNQSKVDSILLQLQTGEITAEKANSSLESLLQTRRKSAATTYYKEQITNEYNEKYFTDDDCTTLSTDGKKALLVSKTDMTEDEINALSDEELEEKLSDLDMTDEEMATAVSKLVTKAVSTDIASDEYTEKIADAVENGIADENASTFLQTTLADGISTIESLTTDYYSVMSSMDKDNSQLAGLGLSEVTGEAVAEGDVSTGMVVLEASDAEIEFNGATLTSSTSTITVNGLTLNVLDITEGSTVNISVTKDTSGIYDAIKDFLSEYNSLLEEMNTYYNADSAGDYDVLTDDEKSAMSDDEVEKWETKIKDSLLRRDDTLSSLISSFRENMSLTYKASNGKTYSLASLGISTSSDYTEGGLLHILGDEDDTEYADETNTLESLLNSDPDLVMEVLTGITSQLYSDLQSKMKTSTLSSALTFYNDKEMNSQLSDYKSEISDWETKLADLEDRYYSQFTAMEKALSSLSSTSSLFTTSS